MAPAQSRIEPYAGTLNLTDEEPPFANVEHAYDGMTHNPKGRRLKLILRYRPGGE